MVKNYCNSFTFIYILVKYNIHNKPTVSLINIIDVDKQENFKCIFKNIKKSIVQVVRRNVKNHKGSVLVTEVGESLQCTVLPPKREIRGEKKSGRLVGFTLTSLWERFCPQPNKNIL